MTTEEDKSKKKAFSLRNMAGAAQKKGDYEKASELIEQAIQIYPKASILWVTKALFLFEAKRFDAALEIVNKSVKVSPKNYFGWLLRAEIYMELGNVDEAVQSYKEYVKLQEHDWAYTILASLESESDPETAIAHAKRALELNPAWEEASNILSRLKTDQEK